MAENQKKIADWLLQESKQPRYTYKWSSNLNNNSLYYWVTDTNAPNILTTQTLTLACFELPLCAAAIMGIFSKENIKDIYNRKFKENKSWHNILNGNKIFSPSQFNWQNETFEIPYGSIVSFNEDEHIAIAVGRDDLSKENKIVNLWGEEKKGTSYMGVDSIKTIAFLLSNNGKRNVVVRYSDTIW
jgi:hypothetical protein